MSIRRRETSLIDTRLGFLETCCVNKAIKALAHSLLSNDHVLWFVRSLSEFTPLI